MSIRGVRQECVPDLIRFIPAQQVRVNYDASQYNPLLEPARCLAATGTARMPGRAWSPIEHVFPASP
jgi:hypothetical protein